ncbi:MAG: TolC family protein [bacterium]
MNRAVFAGFSPKSSRRCLAACALGLGIVLLQFATAGAETQLTLERVRELAHQCNRTYLSAQQEIVKAQGDIGKARAGAFPHLAFGSSYTHSFRIASAFLETQDGTEEIQFGFKNNFAADISLRQPLWEGGKVYTAYSIARQYKRYAEAMTNEVAATVEYSGEQLFYSVILAKARQVVLEDALNTLSHNAEVVQKMYSQGQVAKFDLLRARTEEANLRPQLLAAESNVRLAEKRLKSFLGLALEETIETVEPVDDTSLARLPQLDSLLAVALSSRYAVKQADLELDMRTKAVRIARAGYFPSLAAVSQYSWQSQSDDFRMNDKTTTSFTAGLTLSFPIFDGGLTRAEVRRSQAERHQAELSRMDLIDRIKLQVEEAYDQLVQAKKSLDVLGESIAEAEEGVRIARLRYESGKGTLLELLSAQTALTESATARAAALYAFRNARAGLKLASTIDFTNL